MVFKALLVVIYNIKLYYADLDLAKLYFSSSCLFSSFANTFQQAVQCDRGDQFFIGRSPCPCFTNVSNSLI